jgi:hypothetical protein
MTGSDQYDLLVIGATPAGVTCAVRAAREGLQVLLVTHTHYLGGMISNGISNWDALYEGGRAPIVEEFREKVAAYYRSRYGESSEQYAVYRSTLSFEPHVGEKVIHQLLEAEASSLAILKEYYPIAVERAENLIRAVILQAFKGEETRRVTAKSFVDATYEGDLAALAGVPYRVGRESRDDYGEPHAGRIFTQYFYGQFPREAVEGRLNLRPFELNSGEIFAGSTGEGDGAIQAYNFRSIWSRDPANRRYPNKPDNYDRSTYLVLLKTEQELAGQALPFRSTWLVQDLKDFKFQNWKKLPNNKLNWNHGNFVGQNHDYPTADWAERQEIAKRHRDFDLGLWYFLQNDEAVPKETQERARQWGLALDEFVDNDNFPYEMYVREARRITGRYIFTEHDASLAPGLNRAPIHTDSIAIADWAMDSHECTMERQLGSGGDGAVLLHEKSRPAQIAYRILLPERLDNLLVPLCMSTTHVGWGTVRVEPTLMHIGEVAGFAAALAHREGTTPGDLSVPKLQQTLVENRVMISFFNEFDMQTARPWVAAVQYLGTKGFFDNYDARPEAPLTLPVARVWAQIFGKLIAEKYDPNESARAVAKASIQADHPITAAQFLELLRKELGYRDLDPQPLAEAVTSIPLDLNSELSRGDACRMIYNLLRIK